MEHEEWRKFRPAGFERVYEVSSLGRIRRPEYLIKFTRMGVLHHKRLLPRSLKQQINRTGYPIISLQDGLGGKRTVQVAPIVCAAFSGPRPSGKDCAHLDGNPTNNCATNLAWATCAENEAHKVWHGTRPLGSRHHQAKLSESDVETILRRLVEGADLSTLAKEFDVSKSTISLIKRGKIWRHVRRPENLAILETCTG